MWDRSRPARATSAAAAFAAIVAAVSPLALPAGAAPACTAPPPLSFATPTYVDEGRAGGEPMIGVHPDGTILYSAHAGTTHFYSRAAGDTDSAAFVRNYQGQTYIWRSTDDGKTWTFSPRLLPANAPMSGFSDPDFAIDTAGNVFFSEINLVNIAMSKSTDVARTFTLKNFFAQTLTDRQWSEADTEDVVYMVGNSFGGGTAPTKPAGNLGHVLYKSKDGGATWTPGISDPGGLGDLRVDKRTGTLYEANYDNGVLSMAVFRNARKDDLTRELFPIAAEVSMPSHWPAFDVDDAGNLSIVWDESGGGGRPAGIWYSYSTDGGKHWAKPVRVDRGENTKIWPWIAVGDPGRVGIAWFEAARTLPNGNAETNGTHGWRVVVAQTLNGLGCQGGGSPRFTTTVATPEPIHAGTVCMGGTVCQARLVDRRLGDYFSVEVDSKGMFMAAYSDTARGGAVSLPGFVRQSGGVPFIASKDPDDSSVRGRTIDRRPLPATGLAGLLSLGATLGAAALALRRWTARGA